MPLKINLNRLNTIKNLQFAIVILSAVFILVCLIVATVIFYQKNECKMGRSDGKFRPVCYTNALCNAQNGDNVENRVTVTVNAPDTITSEIITYPNLDGTAYNTVNVNYDDALPVGGLSLFNTSDLGICGTTNTVYLHGISSYREVNNPEWRNLATVTMFKMFSEIESSSVEIANGNNGNTGNSQNSYKLIFITNDVNQGISVTSTENGIFGVSPYLMSSVTGYPDGHIDARDYFFDVAKKNYDDYLNEIKGEKNKNNYSCVDPSVVIPCGARRYNEDLKQWCQGDEYDEECLNFCSPHWEVSKNSTDTIPGPANSNLQYQMTKISNSTINNITNQDAKNLNYTIGRNGSTIPGPDAEGKYLQQLVFCGGVSNTPGSDNYNNALASNIPNADLTKEKINLGF